MRIEKEKAPAGAGTPTRARKDDFAVNHSISNFITDGRKTLQISELLHVGAENALTLRELVQLTGEDKRSIRRRIQAERKAGKLILSDNQNGYFLPENPADVQRFARSMSRRAAEIAGIARAAEAALADMAGQEQIAGWNDG
nr:MAG TPA: Mga helix-turn-helix domain [Bacteriophage sp.]